MADITPVATTRTQSEKTRHQELAEKMAQNTRLPIKDIVLMLKALPFALIDSLELEDDKVFIENLGTFVVAKRVGKVDTLSGTRRKSRDKLVIKFSNSINFLPYPEQDFRDARQGKEQGKENA